jgi:hypothetical protein
MVFTILPVACAEKIKEAEIMACGVFGVLGRFLVPEKIMMQTLGFLRTKWF